ncbi:DNA/RNA non-specific endonuclease [Methylomicrobium sp. Wu6]|uniref:DNA/RNA non-specific endonuclease n=1 Tax=Methylomicrobium sp. Wu6 TaxID=3107928 RepID=UPI002DD6A877|nr:DNA/RNA non-specific endonuclease [Methylomicrobium sp. Wu6]MEC4749020.1 DNA/RNA non-specific endonuclease [Methylomicrobium sp. Wu6]
MINIPSLRPESRYGLPVADHILFNRHYVLGYSYYFRQAKWAMEIVDSSMMTLERADNFRPDFRIPEMFRADLADYEESGFDRGHLVASANQNEVAIQNSETFLLSNMAPQKPQFNRGIWKQLETAVRKLDAKEDIYETYVISGPIFDFDTPIARIGASDDNGVTLPVPNSYFKSVLTEDKRGDLNMWSFVLPNEASDKPLESFLVPTVVVERLVGIFLWDRLTGQKIEQEKKNVRKMWKT